MRTLKVLDVVALLNDLPEAGLRRGQVGTLVEELGSGVFEVEFSDPGGRAYALLALRSDQVMRLLYAPEGPADSRIGRPEPATAP
jgi:hypothetical protein